jgi:hypothetical protein
MYRRPEHMFMKHCYCIHVYIVYKSMQWAWFRDKQTSVVVISTGLHSDIDITSRTHHTPHHKLCGP